MRFEIARARALYASADQGLPWLPPRSAACVRTARILYSRILVEIEGNDYDVFSTRARVSTGRKLATAAWCFGGTIGRRGRRAPGLSGSARRAPEGADATTARAGAAQRPHPREV